MQCNTREAGRQWVKEHGSQNYRLSSESALGRNLAQTGVNKLQNSRRRSRGRRRGKRRRRRRRRGRWRRRRSRRTRRRKKRRRRRKNRRKTSLLYGSDEVPKTKPVLRQF